MRIFRTNSLRTHLLLTLAVAITIGTLVQAGCAYHVALGEVSQISDLHMQRFAHAVSGRINRQIEEGTYVELPGHSNRGFSLIVTQLHNIDPPLLPSIQTGFSTQEEKHHAYRVFTLRTSDHKIQVIQDMDERSVEASRLALRTVLPIIVLAPLLMLCMWWVISHTLQPLVISRREIARRTPDELHPLHTLHVPDELLPFINEINTLFERISKAFAAQQSFIGNAAHELRSPLAALRLQVQRLQRVQTPEARQQATDRLISGIDRATRLIEQMLVLARADAPVTTPAPVDLIELVRMSLSDVMPGAQNRFIEISANMPDVLPDTCSISGNVESLRTMLRNLMENAIKYAPRNGAVLIELQRPSPDALLLSIEDNGPGIPEEERAEVFERFQRGSARYAEGSGLGLAIVRTIAERHKIRISLGESTRLGGLRVTLHCPAILGTVAGETTQKDIPPFKP